MLTWILAVVAASWTFADDSPTKLEPELFPQSAKLARDRRADAVLETARVQLRQKDFAAAIVALQELLDGPNAFAAGGASVPSFVEEANRLLREMPAPGREAYERSHGAEANRLWQEALKSGRLDALRDVIARFGATTAGWSALRDLAARHVDRGEWSLAALASSKLARHPHSSVTAETGWITRWVLSESRLPNRERAARDLWQQFRNTLESSPVPASATDKNLAEWLKKLLPSDSSEPPASNDWRVTLGSAPSGHNVLQVAADLNGDPASWLNDIIAEWNRYDVPALPSAQPLVVGDIVVARFAHPAKVVAVDARRGKLLWEQVLAGSLGSTASDLQRHPGIRTPLVEELQRRWFGDSVRGRLTSDGQRLFLVRDLDDLDLKPGAGSRLRNHLEAWDLATGERRWRIGSSVNEPPTGFEGLYFLGPPLASDGLLYVVAQRELQVALWVVRASDGQLEWTLPLAETDRLQFKDPGWRHIACPVTWASGRLICPTGAGCCVAVDPITRSLAWSVRYERDDISSATGFIATDRDRPFASRWWESWREVVSREVSTESPRQVVGARPPAISIELPQNGGSKTPRIVVQATPQPDERTTPTRPPVLILASPESRSLRAVNGQTGEVVWRAKFEEPLFAAASDSGVLVFERTRVIGVDPANGHERWRTPLPVPDATGDWVGASYVCPTQEGWSMINSATGEVRRSEQRFWGNADSDRKMTSSPKLLIPDSGRLVRVDSRWVVLSSSRLGLFENIASRQSAAVDRMRSNPEDAEARIELSLIARQFGELDEAEKLLRPLLNEQATASKAASPMRELLLRRLAEQPEEHTRFAEELLRLSPDERVAVETRHALIDAARKSNDLIAAMRGSLDLLSMKSEETGNLRHAFNGHLLKPAALADQVKEDNVLYVRRDRWAQGVIEDSLSDAEAMGEVVWKSSNALLQEQRQQALDSADPFALQALSERLSCLRLGRRLRMQLSGRTSSGVGYLKTSLALREIAHGTNLPDAAEAWYRLALLHDIRSEPLDAAACYRELRNHFGNVNLLDGYRLEEWLSDVPSDSPVGRALAHGPSDPWPNPLPKVTPQDEPHDDIYCYLVPVESRDSFWRRVSVSVERQGKKVRFTAVGQRGLWDLPLPASNSPFRHDWTTHRGWGLGPLFVLQVGDSLFGIQPLDERGETNAKVLWTVTSGPYDETGPHQMLPARLGIRLDEYRQLDRHEQPVLDVVHASAGVLCYRTRNRLIAIDPATGERLWTRHQLPPQVSVSGDGELIMLRLLATREIEVRRGFDGKLLSQRIDETDPSSILIEQGRLRLASSPAKPNEAPSVMKLRCKDVVSGRLRWQREHPAKSAVLRIDEARFGVIEPAGTLRFVSLIDGRDLSKFDVEMPEPLSAAHAFADDLRLYVVLSRPVTETSWLNTQQDRGSYRRLMLNGWLLAFERQTLKPLWSIPAKNLPFAVDQPKDVPFLVLPYKRPSDDSVDGQAPDGVLHLIDKRTGKEVFYEAGGVNNVYFSLEPDPLQQRIDVLMSKRRVRLEYGEE